MKNKKEIIFNDDENMLLLLYFEKDRNGTMESLRSMRACLTPEETELLHMTDSALEKLNKITDSDFFRIDSIREIYA